MDNLFNSVKLFTALYREHTLAHGVVRTHGRGLPDAVIQREEKNVKRAESLRGTTKAARMQNNPACPDILAVSVYDTKLVHMLSTVAESVVWTKKTRKVWDGKAKTEMAHLPALECNRRLQFKYEWDGRCRSTSGCVPSRSLDEESEVVVELF